MLFHILLQFTGSWCWAITYTCKTSTLLFWLRKSIIIHDENRTRNNKQSLRGLAYLKAAMPKPSSLHSKLHILIPCLSNKAKSHQTLILTRFCNMNWSLRHEKWLPYKTWGADVKAVCILATELTNLFYNLQTGTLRHYRFRAQSNAHFHGAAMVTRHTIYSKGLSTVLPSRLTPIHISSVEPINK